MPRAKPGTATPVFNVVPCTLTEAQVRDLLDALGLDPAIPADRSAGAPAILDVVLWLGVYKDMQENVEGAPNAGEYRAALLPLRKHADELLSRLDTLNGYIREALGIEGIDLADVERGLRQLSTSSTKALAHHEDIDARGRPKREALAQVVASLCDIFERFSKTPREDRVRVGSQSTLSEWEATRREFVQLALTAGGIAHPDDLLAVIRGLQAPTSP